MLMLLMVMLTLMLQLRSGNLKMNFYSFIFPQNTRQPMKIKKKKTSGYAIFCRCRKM